MQKVLYVLKHRTSKAWLKSKTGMITSQVNEALRVSTFEEAEELSQHTKVPLAWQPSSVLYDTALGAVVPDDPTPPLCPGVVCRCYDGVKTCPLHGRMKHVKL